MWTSIILAVRWIAVAVEWDFSLNDFELIFRVKNLHYRSGAFLFDYEHWRMREGGEHRAAHMVTPIVCAFINRLTGYAEYSKMNTVHVIYISIKSAVTSSTCNRCEKAKNGNCLRRTYVSLERDRELFFRMQISSIPSEVPFARSFGRGHQNDWRYIMLDVSVYRNFGVHIMQTYKRFFRTR